MEEKRLDFGQTAGAFTVVPVKETVIEKAMDGDEKAFEAVFMGTYRYVYATARQYLKNDQDIYDAIQDTYLKVYKSLPRLQSVSSFYPWLHRICENCAKDILAQAGPPTVSLDGEVEVAAADRTEAATVATDVAEVLKQLPPEQAELLVRVYYDKLRVAEIARLQEVPVTTVHNRLRAAKRRLRELLKIRGIDKPVYGGDLIALLSTAIRNAIGTELLSMAIAEEILHKVTGSHNRRGAAVVSHFARKQRSRAALRIASLLMTACALLTATGILVFNLVTGGFRQPETPTAAPPSTTVSTVTTTTTTTTATGTGTQTTTQTTTTATTTSTTATSATTTTAPTQAPLTGSFAEPEVLGSYVADGTLPMATTGDNVYAVVAGDQVKVKTGETAASVCIRDFSRMYGDTGQYLNYFNHQFFWVNQNATGQFVLNRCDEYGHDWYSVVFTETEITYLTRLTVASDGVYFLAGIHGDFNHRQSATLYRTDTDFVIQKTLDNVVDYALNQGRLYYLYGRGNAGYPYVTDRAMTELGSLAINPQAVLSYGSLFVLGDYLVVDGYNPYQHSETSAYGGLAVIRISDGNVMRLLDAEYGSYYDIGSASSDNGGTLIIRFYRLDGTQAYRYTIRDGNLQPLESAEGTVFCGYRYTVTADGLYRSEIDGSNPIPLT